MCIKKWGGLQEVVSVAVGCCEAGLDQSGECGCVDFTSACI